MLALDNILKGLKEGKIKNNKIKKELLDTMLANNPQEKDSLGELCYKLACVTTQMFFNQEELYKIRHMTVAEFETEYKDKMSQLHKTLKRCCDLNYQRSLLIDAIDKLVAN